MLQCYRQYHLQCVDLERGPCNWVCEACDASVGGREASALGDDTKIVIKSSLQVTFSHVHDYVGWLVQSTSVSPKSLEKNRPQVKKKFFLVPPCPKHREE